MDFGITLDVQGRSPIILAIKVSFRVAREEIENVVILCWCRLHRSGMHSGINLGVN